MKRIKQYLISFIVCLASLFSSSMPIHAANTLTYVNPYGQVMGKWSVNLTQYGNWGGTDDYYANLYINGYRVYCVEPLANAIYGSEYVASDLPSFTGGQYTATRLEYISALGYGFNGDYSDEMDFATQIRIWQEINPYIVDPYSIHPDIQAKIDEINARLYVMDTDVSFNRQTVVLQGYGRDFAKTLVDETGVFGYYYDYSTSGVHTERNGNTLTIWAEKGDSLQCELVYDCLYFRTQAGTSIAYANDYSQNVAFLQGADPRALVVGVDVQVGTIEMQKQDSLTTHAQGDATLQGAEFDVIDNLTNEVVGTLVSDEFGKTNRIEDLSTDRTYTIHERKAPAGYLLGQDALVDFSTCSLFYDTPFLEDVIKGRVCIEKIMTNGEMSEIVKPEKDARFEIILKRYVDQYGSFEEALNHVDEMSALEHATLITDEKGMAQSSDLAYGTYLVKQMEGYDETKLLQDSFEVSIQEDGQILSYTINNVPNRYYIKLLKRDKKTQKTITFTSAAFKIKDEKGNIIKMKVGNKTYDTFMTNSDGGIGVFTELFGNTYYGNDDDKGCVMTPLYLEAGTYTIEEVSAPTGFYKMDPMEFVISKDYVSETSDECPVIVVEIDDEQILGSLKLHKKLVENEADVSFIDQDLSNIEFTLYANEDIQSMIDGSILYHKNDVVKTSLTDDHGEIEMNDIPLGKYYIKETKTKDGFVLDDTTYDVHFTEKNTLVEYTIENHSTIFSFSKTDVTGQEELEGASLSVYNDKGEKIDSWVSSKKAHTIEGLMVGKEYTLKEEIAIDGYVKASDITFKVLNDTSVQHVEMVDKIVDVSKEDLGGNEVVGAEMSVKDMDGNIIDSWTSKKSVHRISNLEEGKRYILHEDLAPAGYSLANDIEFVVDSKRENMHLTMIDKKLDDVAITKYDATSKQELPGAKLRVCDANGEVIDEWISTNEAHLIEGLFVGETYTLTEIVAPEKYALAKSIDFVVEDNGKVVQQVKMYDELKTIVHTRVVTHELFFGLSCLISIVAIILFKKKS